MKSSITDATEPALVRLRWKIWLWWFIANVAGYPLAGALFGIMQWRGLRELLWRGAWCAAAGVVGLVTADRE